MLLLSCSNKLEIVEPTYFTPTGNVVTDIIGTWKSKRVNLTLNKDGSFTKRMPITSLLFTKPPKEITLTVLTETGKYEIIDSVIYFKTTNFSFYPDTLKDISIRHYQYKVRFQNGQMLLQHIQVLTKTDNSTTCLNGTWQVTDWVYDKITNNGKIEYTGREITSYNFFSSDSLIYHSSEPDNSPFCDFEMRASYTLNFPIISIPVGSVMDDTLIFKHEKMYWCKNYYEYYNKQ
jgi:hypothetical protein